MTTNRRMIYKKSSACGSAVMDTLRDIREMSNCDRCGGYGFVCAVSCDDDRQVCKKCAKMLSELTEKYDRN